ncbi:MAG: SusC/RagA family TonB-linked outer membrane protein [Balneolaceae bacterium]
MKKQNTYLSIIYLISGALLCSIPVNIYAGVPGNNGNFSVEYGEDSTVDRFQQTISGTITEAGTGEILMGVNIYILELETGTATDLEGNYSIPNVEPGTYTLRATFVGYEPYETSITVADGEDLNLDIELTQAGILGDEVVVVGYGEQRRSDMTGSISSVSSEQLNEVSVTSLESGLQGRSAGVYVNQSGNKPGQGASIRIRGNRSINANNDPLFVVDGVPVSGGIDDINPRDIQSVEILKDASATAIYGARGSNGVIIVSTTRGYNGDISVTYDGSVGFSQALRRVPMMNGEEWAELRREAYRAAGDPRSDADLFHPTELEQIQNGTWTDYQDMLLENGIRNQHQLGIAGGSENARYFLSFGGLSHSGILAPEHFQRYNTRVNIDLDISDRFRIGTSTLGVYSKDEGGTRNFYSEAISNTPLTQPYDENGVLRLEPKPDAQRTNPLLEVLPETYVDEVITQRILSNIYAEYQHNENLNLRVNFSPDLRTVQNNQFQAERSRARQGNPAAAQLRTINTFEYTWENIVNYQQGLADNQSINLTGLFSIQEYQLEGPARDSNGNFEPSISVSGIPLPDMRHHNLGAAEDILGTSSSFEKWSLISYMARANYNYDDRYLITATGRMDGSSRFGAENQFGFFPSVALAWNISNESFFNSSYLLNNLRLRLSWGQTGQTGIDPYRTQGLAERSQYNFGSASAFGFRPSQIRNDDLKWETTTSWNLGVQFEMLDSRIVTELDVYRQDTEDLLLERAIPTTSGYNSVLENVGATRNSGIEASISTMNITSNDISGFQWSSHINFAYNKEEIVELFGGAEDDVGNQWFIGSPVDVYFNHDKIGIWQLGEETEAAVYGQRPGEIKVRDVDGDGDIDGNDRVILGQEQPKWQGGFGNEFNYRNFGLSVLAVWRLGSMISSGTMNGAMTGRYNDPKGDYWTPDNPTNDQPQPRADLERPVYNDTRNYYNGDFLRIRNIGLSYNLPGDVVQRVLGAQTLRLRVNAENPYIYAPFVQTHGGVDPETATGNNTPSRWTLQFGINLSL